MLQWPSDDVPPGDGGSLQLAGELGMVAQLAPNRGQKRRASKRSADRRIGVGEPKGSHVASALSHTPTPANKYSVVDRTNDYFGQQMQGVRKAKALGHAEQGSGFRVEYRG